MASNSTYEQQNFWKTPDLSLLGDSWIDSEIKRLRKHYKDEAERLFYTAQEGSLLDRIWNKKNKK